MQKRQLEQQESGFPIKLGQPARHALAGAGFSSLEQLTRTTEKGLGKLHGMGPKALGLLREALRAKGLRFREI